MAGCPGFEMLQIRGAAPETPAGNLVSCTFVQDSLALKAARTNNKIYQAK
jgi:hypothetical protein